MFISKSKFVATRSATSKQFDKIYQQLRIRAVGSALDQRGLEFRDAISIFSAPGVSLDRLLEDFQPSVMRARNSGAKTIREVS
jgi:hypothetical protein